MSYHQTWWQFPSKLESIHLSVINVPVVFNCNSFLFPYIYILLALCPISYWHSRFMSIIRHIWWAVWNASLLFIRQHQTHCKRVTPIYVNKPGHHWLKKLMRVAYSAPSHCVNQCWSVVSWSLRSKFRWNLNIKYVLENEKTTTCNYEWLLRNGGHFVHPLMR